jgi:hypothetical protein
VTIVLAPGDEYREIAQNDLGEMTLASPAVAGNALFISDGAEAVPDSAVGKSEAPMPTRKRMPSEPLRHCLADDLHEPIELRFGDNERRCDADAVEDDARVDAAGEEFVREPLRRLQLRRVEGLGRFVGNHLDRSR